MAVLTVTVTPAQPLLPRVHSRTQVSGCYQGTNNTGRDAQAAISNFVLVPQYDLIMVKDVGGVAGPSNTNPSQAAGNKRRLSESANSSEQLSKVPKRNSGSDMQYVVGDTRVTIDDNVKRSMKWIAVEVVPRALPTQESDERIQELLKRKGFYIGMQNTGSIQMVLMEKAKNGHILDNQLLGHHGGIICKALNETKCSDNFVPTVDIMFPGALQKLKDALRNENRHEELHESAKQAFEKALSGKGPAVVSPMFSRQVNGSGRYNKAKPSIHAIQVQAKKQKPSYLFDERDSRATPAFTSFDLGEDLELLIKSFLKSHPQDHIDLGVAKVAILTWGYYLDRMTTDSDRPPSWSFLRSHPEVFVLYYPHFLAYHEYNRLGFYMSLEQYIVENVTKDGKLNHYQQASNGASDSSLSSQHAISLIRALNAKDRYVCALVPSDLEGSVLPSYRVFELDNSIPFSSKERRDIYDETGKYDGLNHLMNIKETKDHIGHVAKLGMPTYSREGFDARDNHCVLKHLSDIRPFDKITHMFPHGMSMQQIHTAFQEKGPQWHLYFPRVDDRGFVKGRGHDVLTADERSLFMCGISAGYASVVSAHKLVNWNRDEVLRLCGEFGLDPDTLESLTNNQEQSLMQGFTDASKLPLTTLSTMYTAAVQNKLSAFLNSLSNLGILKQGTDFSFDKDGFPVLQKGYGLDRVAERSLSTGAARFELLINRMRGNGFVYPPGVYSWEHFVNATDGVWVVDTSHEDFIKARASAVTSVQVENLLQEAGQALFKKDIKVLVHRSDDGEFHLSPNFCRSKFLRSVGLTDIPEHHPKSETFMKAIEFALNALKPCPRFTNAILRTTFVGDSARYAEQYVLEDKKRLSAGLCRWILHTLIDKIDQPTNTLLSLFHLFEKARGNEPLTHGEIEAMVHSMRNLFEEEDYEGMIDPESWSLQKQLLESPGYHVKSIVPECLRPLWRYIYGCRYVVLALNYALSNSDKQPSEFEGFREFVELTEKVVKTGDDFYAKEVRPLPGIRFNNPVTFKGRWLVPDFFDDCFAHYDCWGGTKEELLSRIRVTDIACDAIATAEDSEAIV
ncbi:hypothetical protein F4860DRAFT_529127 [Xylaria cubensis]|nr:hypothetical protein F4860DRAFT_529127 [Xylaria cubensis]